MAIKCSLLGHKFGDPEVEREREEQGSEVITTIREVETCTRCGVERVVSENKEVTTLETPDDIDVTPEESADGPSAGVGTDGPAGEGDEAELLDEDPAPETAEGDPAADAETDDAEVIESGPAEGPDDGQNPTTGPDIAEAEADAEESFDPPESAEEDDGVILDADDEGDDVDRSPGEWPDEPAEEDTSDWEPDTGAAAEEADPDPDVESAGAATVTVPDGSFVCPECGFAEPVESSSLRAGDSCPECHRGYLQHESGEA